MEPRKGTVELLGQTLRCAWMVSKHTVTIEEPVVLPVYVPRTTASNLFSALEATCPFVKLDNLFKLTHHMQWVVLVLTADLCGANSRMKHAIAYRVALHNAEACAAGHGVVMIVDVSCSSHIIHGVVEKTFAFNSFIPNMHAIAFSMSIPRQYGLVLRQLRRLVEEDLQLGFMPGAPPPPENLQRNRVLVDMTVLRFKTTRARHTSLHDCGHEQKMSELSDRLLDHLNGKWSLPRVQHHCYRPGCCGGQKLNVCIEVTFALLVAAFFEPLGVKIPSITRWHSFGDTLPVEVGGMVCHQVLPRAMEPLQRLVEGDDQEAGILSQFFFLMTSSLPFMSCIIVAIAIIAIIYCFL